MQSSINSYLTPWNSYEIHYSPLSQITMRNNPGRYHNGLYNMNPLNNRTFALDGLESPVDLSNEDQDNNLLCSSIQCSNNASAITVLSIYHGSDQLSQPICSSCIS